MLQVEQTKLFLSLQEERREGEEEDVEVEVVKEEEVGGGEYDKGRVTTSRIGQTGRCLRSKFSLSGLATLSSGGR